jgi:hypothetical protein
MLIGIRDQLRHQSAWPCSQEQDNLAKMRAAHCLHCLHAYILAHRATKIHTNDLNLFGASPEMGYNDRASV